MKEKLKNDDEIIAQEGNVTINMKELKTTLPNLVDKNRTHLSTYDLIKKLMLLIEIRLEIIQHTLKPILNDSIEVLNKGKETMQETNKLLDEIKEQINVLKKKMSKLKTLKDLKRKVEYYTFPCGINEVKIEKKLRSASTKLLKEEAIT